MTNNEEEIFYSDEDISDSELDPVCLNFNYYLILFYSKKPLQKAYIRSHYEYWIMNISIIFEIGD